MQKKTTENRFKIKVFELASEDEIKKPILSSSSKSCDLDHIPTSVLKNCLDMLMTTITYTINISMKSCTFPNNFIEVHVRPLHKKHLSLKTNLKIINLYPTCVHCQYLRKGSSQLATSSYKNNQPTGNIVRLKVHNDIIMSMDKGGITALTLLDFSSAFLDTLSYWVPQGYVLRPLFFTLYTTPLIQIHLYQLNTLV